MGEEIKKEEPDFSQYLLLPKWLLVALIIAMVLFLSYNYYNNWDKINVEKCTEWDPATQADLILGTDCNLISNCKDIKSNLKTQVQECECLKGNETIIFNKRCKASVIVKQFIGGEKINYNQTK